MLTLHQGCYVTCAQQKATTKSQKNSQHGMTRLTGHAKSKQIHPLQQSEFQGMNSLGVGVEGKDDARQAG